MSINFKIVLTRRIFLLCFLTSFAVQTKHVSAQVPGDGLIGEHYGAEIALVQDFPEEILMVQGKVADLNGDGWDDVVFLAWRSEAHLDDMTIKIWASDQLGSMLDVTDTLIEGGVPHSPAGYRQLIPADFNGDGQMDLLLSAAGPELVCAPEAGTSCWPGGLNSLLLSNESGKLVNVTATNMPAFSDHSHGTSVGDFANDGDIDIWVQNTSGCGGADDLYIPVFPYMLYNDGNGAFTVAADAADPECGEVPIVGHAGILPDKNVYPGAWWTYAIDADGDGDTDLGVAWSEQFLQSHLLVNDGEGHFTLFPGESFPRVYTLPDDAPGNTQRAIVHDFNEDGLDDLLLHQSGHGFFPTMLQMLISNGDGTFADESDTRYPDSMADSIAFTMFLHDLDGDGHEDIFTYIDNDSGVTLHNVQIRLNDGEGFFRRLPDYWVDDIHDSFWAVLDVDNDGGTDFLINPGADAHALSLYKMILPYGPELDGNSSANRLIGGALDNVFRGFGDHDFLDGGLGNDWLIGGTGNDILIGGKGDDAYAWVASDLDGHDLVTDKQGADRLRFKGFGLDLVTGASQDASGNLVLQFVGGGSLLVEQHFTDPMFSIEFLQTDGCTYPLSNNSAFTSGDITELLGDCIAFFNGFEDGLPPEPEIPEVIDPCDIGARTWAPEARNCGVENCDDGDGRYKSWDGKIWCRALITQEGENWQLAVPPGVETFDFWVDWGAWDMNSCGDGVSGISIPACGLNQEVTRDGEEIHLTCDVSGLQTLEIQKEQVACEYIIIGDPHYY